MSTPVRVGFVGFGEAASCFATGLHEAGLSELAVFCDGPRNRPPYSDAFRERVAVAGARTVESMIELIDLSDVIFSAVVASAAEEVGLKVAELLRPGQLLVDINASAPPAKLSVGDASQRAGALYVDVSLMGAVSLYRHKVPLYVSGSGAERLAELFAPAGLKITVVGERAGAAALLKMLRSVATKGMCMALLEALIAAARAGLGDQAFKAICEPMDDTTFTEWAVMCILTDGIHAQRRAEEMEAASKVLQDLGMEPVMTEAAVKRLHYSAALRFRELYPVGNPTDYRETLALYVTRARDLGLDPAQV